MQGHSWTNPDEQRMLRALQSKPDTAYTPPILWQVSIWYLEPMKKKAKGSSFIVYCTVMLLFNSQDIIFIPALVAEHMHWILLHNLFTVKFVTWSPWLEIVGLPAELLLLFPFY